MRNVLLGLVVCAALAVAAPAFGQNAGAGGDAPKVFLDKPPKVVAYQLKRLSNEQLVKVERSFEYKKYKPVYEALLTRKGLDKKYRQEAIEGLSTINDSNPLLEVLNGLALAEKDDVGTQRELVALLFAGRPASDFAEEQEALEKLAAEAPTDAAKQAAYAALATAAGNADGAWAIAEKNNAVATLLGSVWMIPDAQVRATFYERTKPLVTAAPDPATQVAAIDALGYIPGHEAEAFDLLATVIQGTNADQRVAAVRSLRRIPSSHWAADKVEPLAQAVLKLVEQTPADQRTSPNGIESIQLGNDLAAALGPKGAPVRKALRDLGVRVVLLKTIREQMLYDLRYFVVEKGKPVQVVLANEDAMPHNWVLTEPGAMQEVATAAATLAMPTDPTKKKPFVPAHDKVIEASFLAQPGETTAINFTAPDKAGEYDYVCTFPGHWVRMYGVMVVVDDLDKWDQSPAQPTDPLTKKPIANAKVDVTELGPPPAEEHKH